MPTLVGDMERRRAWLLAQKGELAAAEQSARTSVEMETSHGQAANVASSLVALGTIVRWSGRPLDAIPVLEGAVEAAMDERDRASALTELASTLIEVQRADQGLGALARAEQIYVECDDLRGQAEVMGIRARIQRYDSHGQDAFTTYETAIELCRRIGYLHGEGVNLTNLANLQQLQGGVAEALRGYDRAAHIFDELGNSRGEAMVLANSASARHNLLGEDDQARTDATRAMGLFRAIGDRAREAQCQEILAGIAARAGNYREARRLLTEGIEALRSSGNVDLEAQHLRSLALVQLETGDLTSAEATVEEAIQLCTQTGLDDLRSDLVSIDGLIRLRAGDTQNALRTCAAAVDSVSAGANRSHLVYHRHALVAEAVGEGDDALMSALRADAVLRKTLAGLPAAEFERAVQAVPDHRAIVEMAGRFAPRTVDVSLPLAETPTGRPLEAGDLREITWTVEHPDDDRIESPIDRRRARIARLLAEAESAGTSPTTEHLADALGVSPSTVRRDLTALRDGGHAASTRGQRRRIS